MPLSTSTPIINFGNVHDAVVDRIREMILSGELKPDERLRQDELANNFGVSTMPIREALRHLQAEGLVAFHPRRGATVARLTTAEYEEIYRIREELEILACRWAAEHFERIPIDQLKRLLAEIEIAENNLDVPRRLELVRDFFFSIFEASEKEHLLRVLSSLWDLSQQYRRYFSSIPEIVPQRIELYRSIYRNCKAQDPEGLVKSVRDVFAFVKSTLIPRLRESQDEEGTS